MILKKIILFPLLIFLASCGSFTVTPRACRTTGFWGPKALNEQVITADYYLFTLDKEVMLRDILLEHNLQCDQIKSMRLKLTSSFLFKRTVEVYYVTDDKVILDESPLKQ